MSTSIQSVSRIYRRNYWQLLVGFSVVYAIAFTAGLLLLVR
jgi:hypothetical protein